MRILSIETSCDETAIAVLSVKGKDMKCTIESHHVASQIELHAQYGGVFPMMAKREHAKNIVPLFLTALKDAKLLTKLKKPAKLDEKKIGLMLAREPELLEIFLREMPIVKKPKIDRIAVTVGPGLEPALWVGINFAKALSLVWGIPLVPVNHMEGHVLSIFPKGKKEFSMDKMLLPAISLLVSGGHTEIVRVKGVGKYKIIGQTLDDAAGEAFDKVARMLGMAYPGGPEVSRLAEVARVKNLPRDFKLPRPMLHTPDFNFSFSGLKTAVLYLIKKLGDIDEDTRAAICREFEDATVDVLVSKTIKAGTREKAKSIIVGGGVSANKQLRKVLEERANSLGMAVHFPVKELTTDNAIMIGMAGYFAKPAPLSSKKFIAQGNMAF